MPNTQTIEHIKNQDGTVTIRSTTVVETMLTQEQVEEEIGNINADIARLEEKKQALESKLEDE